LGVVFIFTGVLRNELLSSLSGLFFMPIILGMFIKTFFQKLFAAFLTYQATAILSSLSIALLELADADSRTPLLLAVISILLLSGYLAFALKFGRRIFQRLFAGGDSLEWALYSLGSIFSFVVIIVMRHTLGSGWVYILLLFLTMWSLIMLCYAIINTHEKTKQKIDAEFAISLVSSGREHYQKMNDMYDKLRILRHDYKYHINAARAMLKSGDAGGADDYLTDVGDKLSKNEMHKYCSNAILNALIESYAERCAVMDIRFDVSLALPEELNIPDYDMCVVIGNLLENAVEACAGLAEGRTIELSAKLTPMQLLIMVKNSFSGNVKTGENGAILSDKTNGGLGTISVKEIIARHEGDFLTEWNNETFLAYVAIKL
jgi:sensor histidine kinase YesM